MDENPVIAGTFSDNAQTATQENPVENTSQVPGMSCHVSPFLERPWIATRSSAHRSCSCDRSHERNCL